MGQGLREIFKNNKSKIKHYYGKTISRNQSKGGRVQHSSAKTLPSTIEIIDGGMVTTKEQSMAAGDKFRAADVDLVILQMLTYCTSYNMLPAVRDLDVPVVIVNLQKKLAPDYAKTDIPTWLGELYACGAIGEMVADLNRAGKRSAVITGE